MWKKNFNFPLLNVKISDSGNPNHLTTVSLGKNLENFGTVDLEGDRGEGSLPEAREKKL